MEPMRKGYLFNSSEIHISMPYNDELCYMVSYSYTKANGMSYANQVFVGNKTLEVYDFSEVYR